MISHTISLRKKLLAWISIPVLLAGFFIALLAFAFSWHEIEEVYDAQLVHSAKVLLQLTEHEILENGQIQLGSENLNLQHRYEKKIAFRIWHNDRLVAQSANAENFDDFQAPPGFSDQNLDGKPWRFFVFLDPSTGLRTETSERYAIRYEMIGQLMWSLFIPALLFIPMIILVIWIGVRKSLKPLIQVSNTVDERRPDDLTPIPFDGIPSETLPLIQALNRLFSRIEESFRHEREFTDNAAHELRTPLAAMKTQTQVLMKKAAQMPDCHEGLKNLNAIIDRSTHLIEQILALSRLQNEDAPLMEMSLSECVTEIVEELAPISEMKRQNLQVKISDSITIHGNFESLSILVRNILDNAIKYTPEGGIIGISVSDDGRVKISDTGPGLPDIDKKRAFERFVRMDRTGEIGSGLGLSIAKRIADMHHASIRLEDNKPHGLIVTIEGIKKI